MKKTTKGRSAFAVVRVYRDQLRKPVNEADFEALCDGTFSVVRILNSRAEGLAEARRLNELNSEKGAYYYCQHTRFDSQPSEPVQEE